MDDIGITRVIQEADFVRIELENEFYIALTTGGMIVGRTQYPHDEQTSVTALGADQIARTIMTWEFARYEDPR